MDRMSRDKLRRPAAGGLGVTTGFLLVLSMCACSAMQAGRGKSPQGESAVDGKAIGAAGLRQHMLVLASDEMEGRETGTPGFDRAAAYVVDHLTALGVKPGAEHWRQSLTVRRTRVDESGTSLTIQRGRETVSLAYGEDYVSYGVRGTTGETSVSSAVVYAGDGVSIPDRSLDPYREVTVRDRIVVLAGGAPPSLSEGERSFYGDATQKAATAAAHGARAVLLVDDPQIPWDLRVRAARQLGTNELLPLTAADRSAIPVVYVNQRVAAQLLGGGASRRQTSPVSDAHATLRLRQQSREVRSANVVGVLPGRDSRLARELVVISAHCDHVGIGEPVQGDAIYNGAVDNASGVAALLEIAKALAAKPPGRSVVFLCTTGEELGLIGARYFVAHRQELPGAIVAAINIDGTSIQPFRHLDVRGGSNSSLGSIAEEAGRRTGIDVRHETLGVGGSDHSPFLLAGIPPVWIGATLPEDWMRTRYHTPQDDMQQPIDMQAVATYTRFVSTLARLVADKPTRPAWRSGEFFAQPRQ